MTLPGATGRSLPQCRKPPERPSQPYVTAIASASLATPCDGTTRSEHRGSFRVNPNAELLQLRGYTSHHRVRWKTVVSYQLPVVSFVMKSPNAVIPSERPCLWTASRGTPIVGGASAIKILQLAHALSRGLASG